MFDFAYEISSKEPSLLHQTSGDDGASVRIRGRVERFGADDVVGVLAIFGAVVAVGDEVFERIGDSERIVGFIGRDEGWTDAGTGRATGGAKTCRAGMYGQEKQYRPAVHGGRNITFGAEKRQLAPMIAPMIERYLSYAPVTAA